MRLEELRTTLAEHADGIEDLPQARIAPVHQRITVARRRRRTVVAGVVAAAVAAVALAVVPPFVATRDLAPAGGDAPAQLAGRAVPHTQVATGLTYRYVRGYQSPPGAGRLVVPVTVTDRPRLVMWASSDTDRRPVVRLTDLADPDSTQISSAGGFDRYTMVNPYGDGRTHVQKLRLTQRDAGKSTRLAVAVYDVTDLSHAGVGNGTVVFRRQVAGEPLVKAAVGRPGQDDLRVRVKLPTTDVSLAYTCYGSTHWLSVGAAGQQLLGSQCQRHPDLDAGANRVPFDSTPLPDSVRPGDTIEVRIHLSPSAKHLGKVADDPAAVLGVALYRDDGPHHRVLGTRLADHVESDGHDWIASRWEYSPVGARSLRIHLPASDRPRLVTWVADGTARRSNRIVLGASRRAGGPVRVIDQYGGAGESPSSGSGYVVQPGEAPDVVVSVPRGGTSRTRLALVISDQVR